MRCRAMPREGAFVKNLDGGGKLVCRFNYGGKNQALSTRRLQQAAGSRVLATYRIAHFPADYCFCVYNRRVPWVWSRRCACEQGAMTVKHVLLVCPRWQDIRQEIGLERRDIRWVLTTR